MQNMKNRGEVHFSNFQRVFDYLYENLHGIKIVENSILHTYIDFKIVNLSTIFKL